MPTINDGDVPYGCYLITLGSAGFVAESISFTEASSVIERRNELNAPSGQIIIPDFVTGTGVVQRPASSTPSPRVGDVAVIPSNALAGFTGSLFVSDVGPAYAQGDVHKFNFSFRKSV
jgi:hypothetical protein